MDLDDQLCHRSKQEFQVRHIWIGDAYRRVYWFWLFNGFKNIFTLTMFQCPAFAFKCMLSPTVQAHLLNTYDQPVLRSGLSALPIRPVIMIISSIFHNKMLRGFLKWSNSSPVPALYFLLGELHIEAKIHIDAFSLLFIILSNPTTTVHKLVHYLLHIAAPQPGSTL